MKVVVLTSAGQIYASIVLERIISQGIDEVIVFSTDKIFPNKSLIASFSKIIRDSGLKYFLHRVLEAMHQRYLVLMGRAKTIGKLVSEHSIQNYDIEDINSQEVIEILKGCKPDLLISIYFPQIIKKQVLDIPSKGCINIHRAPLPKYRGPCSIFWQLANGEPETGATIHYLGEGLDSGAILAQKYIPVEEDDTIHSQCIKHAHTGGEMIISILDEIRKGETRPLHQDEESATKYPFPTKESMNKFLSNGKKFF